MDDRTILLQAIGLAKVFTLHNQGGIRLPVFDRLDMTLQAGDCLAVVGPSGAGKSSLIRCLYGNYLPQGGQILVRHRGEPLKALQHVVDMAFGRQLDGDKRVFVDALGYRAGKDVELRQMARLLAEKVKQTGVDQQLGPLNPYERRLVHLSVAEVPGVATESVGDAFSKTVLISVRK